MVKTCFNYWFLKKLSQYRNGQNIDNTRILTNPKPGRKVQPHCTLDIAIKDRKYVGKKATSSYPILPKMYESKRARHFLTKGGLLLPFERKFENTLALLVLNLS